MFALRCLKKMFFFGIVSQMFVQLLFSILLFNFHSIPIYVSPQVPLQVGSPTRTILKLRSFLSSRWPHSTGDYTVHITQLATQYRKTTQYTLQCWPHSKGDFTFFSYLTSVGGIVEVILYKKHSFGDVVLHSWDFLQ